jgi:hypothetical protein
MHAKKIKNNWSLERKSLINEPQFIHVKFFIYFADFLTKKDFEYNLSFYDIHI